MGILDHPKITTFRSSSLAFAFRHSYVLIANEGRVRSNLHRCSELQQIQVSSQKIQSRIVKFFFQTHPSLLLSHTHKHNKMSFSWNAKSSQSQPNKRRRDSSDVGISKNEYNASQNYNSNLLIRHLEIFESGLIFIYFLNQIHQVVRLFLIVVLNKQRQTPKLSN